MMKLWMYENHIYELRSEELNQVWSSQLYKQLLQLRKESLKKKSSSFREFITNQFNDLLPVGLLA